MPVGICRSCGRDTNSAVSNWGDKKPEGYGVITECYVAWDSGKPVKGCAFDTIKDPYLKMGVCNMLRIKYQIRKKNINKRTVKKITIKSNQGREK